ncbi:Hypothetical predicted protein [Paramuricea clavata]|uniref:Uncharacterized protein n=1 Tax=Paramuricea clavata TaxID=317549 RepID=A0A6S7FCE2_PARCT|nr:Hypothetical predicted protein [Paramuricea clavata]
MAMARAVVEDFPFLKDEEGQGFIELDFALVLPESVSDNLFLKWTPSFANKVIKYAEDQAKWQVYLGINMEQINSGKCLERSNLVEAVDSCFKLFYVLDMEYPWQSNVTWEFFQKVVYCLEDKTPRKTTSAVISMRATLTHMHSGPLEVCMYLINFVKYVI